MLESDLAFARKLRRATSASARLEFSFNRMATRDLSNASSQWAVSPTDSTDSFARSEGMLPWIIPVEDVVIHRNAPIGTHGAVFRGTWKNAIIAVKVLATGVTMEALMGRMQLWESFKHPHVLRVFGACSGSVDPLLIIIQCHPNGCANQYLLSNPGADRVKILYEAALGMSYIHGRGFVHGGFKPTNILITETGEACVADSGMIELQPSNNNCAHRYFSPEAWKGASSQPSDVFAFAMSAFEIFTSVPPWGVLAEKHIFQLVVREHERPECPEPPVAARVGLTTAIWEIIESAWHKEAMLRPTFQQIVNIWPKSITMEHSRMRFHDSNSPASQEDYPDSLTSVPPAYDEGHAAPHTSSTITGTSTKDRNVPVPRNNTSTPQILRRNASANAALPSPNDGPAAPMPRLPGTAFNAFREGTWSPQVTRQRLHETGSSLSRASSTAPSERTYGSQPFSPLSASFPSRTASLSAITPIDEDQAFHFNPDDHMYNRTNMRRATTISTNQSIRLREYRLGRSLQPQLDPLSDRESVSTENSYPKPTSALLLAGALQMEVTEGRKPEVIDDHLLRIHHMASTSDKDAQRLITAGTVSTLIVILKSRAVEGYGLEPVLMALGTLAYDSLSANTIYRTNTSSTLIEIFKVALSDEVAALSIWCLGRICRSAEVAMGLIKQGLASLLIRTGLKGNPLVSRYAAWCLGSLIRSDALADSLVAYDLDVVSVNHLRTCVSSPERAPDDICAAIYVVARLARSVKICKGLAKAGCSNLLVHYLNTSDHPQVLYWSARAVGCLMRPNSLDLAKALLDAGAAHGLARIPRVLPIEEVEPLASFAFAVQRFSCAEWGGKTRKALVDAGVVDALLAAMRTASETSRSQVLVELALAICLLGDVGGTSIRKEIVSAGGINILEKVGASGPPEVGKVCHMAVTSITGNLWTRNAASAKAAMAHNWTGGCPDYQPLCPTAMAVPFME